MKKLFFTLIMSSLAFVLACPAAPNPTPTPTNTSSDPDLETVAIVVVYDTEGKPITLATEPIWLDVTNSPKRVRWCVYNNLSEDVTSVNISAFVDSATSAPATFSTTASNMSLGVIVPGGDAVCTAPIDVAGVSSKRELKYSIRVTTVSGNNPGPAGPRIIVY